MFHNIPSSLTEFISQNEYPHLWIQNIPDMLMHLLQNPNETALNTHDLPHVQTSGQVYIHPSVRILGSVYIEGPAYIGPDCELRHGAFIRKNTIALEGNVIGNSSETKHCLLLPYAKAPHYNYIGDSILGYNVNMGAGSKCANVRLDKKPIKYTWQGEKIWSKMPKMGAIIFDNTQIGCNTTIAPGCIIHPDSKINSLMNIYGEIPAQSLIIHQNDI